MKWLVFVKFHPKKRLRNNKGTAIYLHDGDKRQTEKQIFGKAFANNGKTTNGWYCAYQCLVRPVPMAGTHRTNQWYDDTTHRFAIRAACIAMPATALPSAKDDKRPHALRQSGAHWGNDRKISV
ncbi:MAG: hypothetical protein SPI30_02140 [Prevotella sp.]|nr:hypothetical protein [Prevotella sp.]